MDRGQQRTEAEGQTDVEVEIVIQIRFTPTNSDVLFLVVEEEIASWHCGSYVGPKPSFKG